VILEDREGFATAAMPLYAKGHSYGEYLFDWDWARAAAAFGVSYYPKLQAHVPFTPATGPKILVRRDVRDPESARKLCLETAADLVRANGLSQAQLLFGSEDDVRAATTEGWLPRYGFQYHWRPAGEHDFEGFLDRLKSRKRKTIARERRDVRATGLALERWTGERLRDPAVAAFFADCYEDTCDRRGGIRYLNRDFFERVFATMADRVTLAVALREGTLVAGALFLHKGGAVFGRHWGARESVPFLHFELCYYQGIELALERGARVFEAGAQGEHKIPRGFLPEPIRGAYHVPDPAFRAAVARYLETEARDLKEVADALAAESPYRSDG
jgi:predicted N-acyltransferase